MRREGTSVTNWDHEADVVVVGSGAAGLPAAVAAAEAGASVIIVEANFDVGGHAIISGGNLPLGGGTSAQKRDGIVDSPEILFRDLTDWSVLEVTGFPTYRFNDREIMWAFAQESAPTYEWLLSHGVKFVDTPVDNRGAGGTGQSALRENHLAAMDWPMMQSGKPQPPEKGPVTSSGIGLIRPMEVEARRLGCRILLKHHMDSIIREERTSGRVLGITASNEGREVNIRARRGVIIATGGSTGNVNFRRMFDPRLTEEYCGLAGMPYSDQDASGELAAMAIGASLWGAYNQTADFGAVLTKAYKIGCQYGYQNLTWQPTSPVFHLARATGLRVDDWQDVILVNQAGLRFYDETAEPLRSSNNYNSVKGYEPYDWRNVYRVKFSPKDFINAALAGTGEPVNGGGPIWAIFDAEACRREKWVPEPPYVDIAEGFFFSGNTIAELAANIKNKYQRRPMPADVLQKTVDTYNSFVDLGEDLDFGKPKPLYKIETPPFYAAWSTPVVHDTRVGLRINARCEVVDLWGQVIPGLYCGGESAGGFSMHGLARCVVQGRIAGMQAAGAGGPE